MELGLMDVQILCYADNSFDTIVGAFVNRQTVKSVQSCGFKKVLIDLASNNMVKLIQAIK